MFRRHSLDEISKKTRNKEKNRKRNRILNFRVSEEEYDLINKKIEISGLKKQDYFLQMLLNHEVKLVSDYRLSDNIAKEIFQLAKVTKPLNVHCVHKYSVRSIGNEVKSKMKRTISIMTGKGSVNHNGRKC